MYTSKCVNCGENPADYNGFCEYCQNPDYRAANKKKVVTSKMYPDSRPAHWPKHCKYCGGTFNKYDIFYEDCHMDCYDEHNPVVM